MLKNKKILLIITGSIAAYKACTLISKLVQSGCEVQVVLSKNSLNFIGLSTIEGLSGRKAMTDLYADGHSMDHIQFVRWADLIIVAPATANYINKITAGLGDELSTALFLAHDFKKPFLIAPAMNTMMYLHPTTQASIKNLKNMGAEILDTGSGSLACGEVGSGRLLEPEYILQEIEKRFSIQLNKTQNSQRVLITGGGTSEPIDDVRVITNKSTGSTASAIANHFNHAGFQVTYLHSENSVNADSSVSRIAFNSFLDLQSKMKTLLTEKHFEYVIHLAAVSDYSVDPSNGKIDSSQEEVTLKLKRNPKIIAEIKTLSPHTQLVGFKLTSTLESAIIKEKVQKLFQVSHCDFVVQNDWNDIKNNQRIFNLYSKNSNEVLTLTSTENLAEHLIKKLMENL